MIRESVFKRYFLPGFVFQSVVIAGGYGTGRELVEFFLTRGPLGGLLLIILAVIAAAAGSILEETFGFPYAFGVITIMIAVGFLVFRGTAVIEKFFAGWSFVLYAVYLVLSFGASCGSAQTSFPDSAR